MHILPGLNMTCFVQNGQGETKLGICNQGDLTKSKSYERPINKILHTRTCLIISWEVINFITSQLIH